jgi:hypothetical protein
MPERGTSTTSHYRGTDAYSTQRDAWEVRRRLLPRADQLVYGGHDLSGAHTLSATNLLSADTTYWSLLRPLTADMQLKEARLRVTTVSPGNLFRSAFYRLAVVDGVRSLLQVQGTRAQFPTDAIAVVAAGLETEPLLYAGTSYFLGFMATSATPRVNSAVIFEEQFPLLQKTSTPDLPPVVAVQDLDAPDNSSVIPLVAYYSPVAAEVW